MKRLHSVLTAGTVIAALGIVAMGHGSAIAADAVVADFYRGKQVKIMIGFGAGGSSSLYAQVLGRHMGRYLAGNPGFVAQNMPGAGGLTVANYIYNNAPRDGSEFAITARTAALEPLLGNKNARFDALKLNWIGNANIETGVCTSWHNSPIKTAEDALGKPFVVAGTGSDSLEVLIPKALNNLLGAKFKIIQGYQASTDALLAVERGEVMGFCGLGWTYLKLRKSDWLKDKKVNVLFQMALERHPDLRNLPTVLEFAKTDEDRQIMEFLLAPQEMGRPFFAPPDVPAARIAALRDAFAATLKDETFLAEAQKQGLEVQLVTGEAIHALLEKIYSAPKRIIERAKAVTE